MRYGYIPNPKSGSDERFHAAVGMRRRAELLPAALGIQRLGLNLTEGRDSRLLATMFRAHSLHDARNRRGTRRQLTAKALRVSNTPSIPTQPSTE